MYIYYATYDNYSLSFDFGHSDSLERCFELVELFNFPLRDSHNYIIHKKELNTDKESDSLYFTAGVTRASFAAKKVRFLEEWAKFDEPSSKEEKR